MRQDILALASAGAFGLLLGSAVSASAQSPGTATIEVPCISPGGSQTVTVGEAAGTFVVVELQGGGTASGVTNAQGTFTDSFTVSSTARGPVNVAVAAFTSQGLALGSSFFTVVGANTPCPSPSAGTVTFNVDLVDETQASAAVKKTCAAGVSGSATFTTTVTGNESTIPGPSVVIACGATVNLPKIPVATAGWSVRLHESQAPTNGVAAADVTLHVTVGGPVTVINNTAASVPTTPVLANTGGGSENPMLPWPVVVLGALLASVGAGLLIRRRTG